MDLNFSAGANPDQLNGEVEALLKDAWELDEERMGLKKTYHFKTYTKCQVERAAIAPSVQLGLTPAGFLQCDCHQKQIQESSLSHDGRKPIDPMQPVGMQSQLT